MMATLTTLIASLGPVGHAIGIALLGMLTQLLSGRTFKKLILWPFEAIAAKTANKKDDEIVEDAKQDLGIEEKKNDQ